MQEKKYSPEIRQMKDHLEEKYEGKTMFNEKEVAEILGTTVATLQVNRSRRIDLDYIKFGKKVFYSLFVILDKFEAGRVTCGDSIRGIS